MKKFNHKNFFEDSQTTHTCDYYEPNLCLLQGKNQYQKIVTMKTLNLREGGASSFPLPASFSPVLLFFRQGSLRLLFFFYCKILCNTVTFFTLLALSQMPSMPSPVPNFPDFCPLLSLTVPCSPPLTSLTPTTFVWFSRGLCL